MQKNIYSVKVFNKLLWNLENWSGLKMAESILDLKPFRLLVWSELKMVPPNSCCSKRIQEFKDFFLLSHQLTFPCLWYKIQTQLPDKEA